jgi:hypothetical protein
LPPNTCHTYIEECGFRRVTLFHQEDCQTRVGLEVGAFKNGIGFQPPKGGYHPRGGWSTEDPDGSRRPGEEWGYRVLYYLRLSLDTILFIDLFPKNEKENLTDREKNELARFIRSMK